MAEESTPTSRNEVLWEGGFSWKAMFGWWLVAAVVTILLAAAGVASMFTEQTKEYRLYIWIGGAAVAALLWLWLLGLAAYRRMSLHYKLTPELFEHREGVLSTRNDRIELIDINDIAYEQGMLDRMMDTGTIKITSSDVSHGELVLIGIENVGEVCNKIDAARRAIREQRAVQFHAV